MPAAARRLRIVQWIGLGVALAAFVFVLVAAAADGPAVLGIAPLVAGVAVGVVAASRSADLGARTAVSIRDDAAAWRATELAARARAAHPDLDDEAAVAAWQAAAWGVPEANPFTATTTTTTPTVGTSPSSTPASFRRNARLVFGATAGAAAFLLVIGATAGVAPVVRAVQENSAGQTLALGLQNDDGTAPDQTGPSDGTDGSGADGSGTDSSAPYVSDDGTITASAITDDDTWQGTCGATDFASNCWAWEIDGDCSGTAEVTVGFSSTQDGADTRTVERPVLLTAGTPLVLTEQGTEDWSGISDITCGQTSISPVGITKTMLDSDALDADGAWPDGCVDFGCAAWEVTPETDCSSATVQFTVDEEVGDIEDPHDLVVSTPLHAGEPADVYAAGAWSDSNDASLDKVTCG